MKVALFLDGDCYNGDEIFNKNSPLNRDNNCWMWRNLKKYLNDRNIDIHTHDVYNKDNFNVAVFSGLYYPNSLFHQKLLQKNIPCYYVAFEPPIIHHWNHPNNLMSLRDKFKKISTWQEDLIGKYNFNRIIESKTNPDKAGYKEIDYNNRLFCSLLSSYRYGNFIYNEYPCLYTKRFEIAKYLEELNNEFHLYGRGFNDANSIEQRWPDKRHIYFNNYRGIVENKITIICKYKFNICFENCYGLRGYITEKIIDTFHAKTIPIYWGATNPTDYFPKETFIDIRDFENYHHLYEYMISISKSEFETYISNINNYLNSELYEKYFGKDVFPKLIYDMLIEDTIV